MYTLLPFRFGRLDDGVLVVTDVGEYHFLSPQEFDDFTHARLAADNPLLQDLKGKFIAADTELDSAARFQAVKYRTKKAFLDTSVCLHMVVPTIRCNCGCVYCQVGSHPSGRASRRTDMSLRTAKRVVDVIHQSPERNLKIEFQGGEPLLAFETVAFLVTYSAICAAKTGKQIEYVICTNLTELPDRSLRFLKRHKVAISTSLDGPRNIHDRQRPSLDGSSSYGTFCANLLRARSLIGEDSVSALLTVTKANSPLLTTVIDEYVARGFHSIFIRPINPFGRAVTCDVAHYPADEFTARYLAALDYILEINRNGYRLADEFVRTLLGRILTPFGDAYVDLQSPAGAGRMCALYNYDGNVYASDEGRMLAEMGDPAFLLGNVKRDNFQGIFGNPLVARMATDTVLESYPQCRCCPYLPYCGSDPVRDYVEVHSLGGKDVNPSGCRLMRPIFQHLFRVLRQDDWRTDVFWSWVTGRPLQDIMM